jgi:hypothetical protein
MTFADGDPLQYLSFGATFSRTFSLFFDRFDVFLALSSIVLVPFGILITTGSIFAFSLAVRGEGIPDFHPTHLPLIGFVLALQVILYAVITIVGRGAMIRAVAELYLGDGSHPVHWMACFRKSLEQIKSLMGASVIVAGGMILGAIVPYFIFCMGMLYHSPVWIVLSLLFGIPVLIALIYIYISLIMSSPAIIIEQRTAVQGLRRSWELANGSRCYIMCTLFCFWVVKNMVSRLLTNMFLYGDVMEVLFSVAGIVMTILLMLIFFPLHTM